MTSSNTIKVKDDGGVLVDLGRTKKKINLEFMNMRYRPRSNDEQQKNILNDVSGTFYAGRLTAIIGPSGAGKSSLLNVLSGFKIHGVTGTITTNGKALKRSTFRRKVAYIPQDFALLSKLTVLETLEVAASLKLKSTISSVVRRQIIDNIVDILKLNKCLKTFVDKLSGGEKKRLSIGTELITNPPLMFFDEPTSGLDSNSSLQVISHLKDLALSGHTIICVVHQPSSRLLELFDDLYVLSEGLCIYSGPMELIVEEFHEAGYQCPQFYNRADFALEIASQERTGNLEKLISKYQYKPLEYSTGKGDEPTSQLLNGNVEGSSHHHTWDYCSSSKYPVTKWTQFRVLLQRNMQTMMRDFFFVQMRVICHILIGILLGVVFFDIGNDASKIQSNVSCLFFFLLFIFFANAMPSVLAFPLETSVFLREHLNNYYPLSVYYVAKLIADLPLLLIGSTTFMVGAYYMTGQPNDSNRLLMMWGISFLTTILAQLTGLIAGSAFSLQLGNFIVPCSTIPMLIFSGFFIKLNELIPCLQPLTYISYFRYAFEGSVLAIYGFNRTHLECHEMFCYFRDAEKFLKHMNMDQGEYWMDVSALGAWIVLMLIVLYVSLKVRLIRNQ